MSFFSNKKILVTHNGTFHADDLFATAVLYILHDGNVKIIRTRDKEKIAKADYVYDVGGIYDPNTNRFDHHQKGGAGKRENGIPYASFGLVWKSYGEVLTGGVEAANLIDMKIVQPIDARDNGTDISKPIFENIFPYSAESAYMSAVPTWKESNDNIDEIFKRQVLKVVDLLKREIKVAKDDVEGRNLIVEAYKNSQDKNIVLIDTNFPRYLYQNTLSRFPEPIYLVFTSGHSSLWKIEAIKKDPSVLESRKPFPESWRGVLDEKQLQEISGISDIIFCHQNGFLAETKSKEGALALANKALLA